MLSCERLSVTSFRQNPALHRSNWIIFREIANCLGTSSGNVSLLPLAWLSDGGADSTIERRTFIPLLTGVRALYVPRSLGVSGVSHFINGASC